MRDATGMAQTRGADPRAGIEIAGYRIDEVIGRGGLGVVYRAHDVRLGRDVALKLLGGDLAEDEAFRRRFERESRIAASLQHPAIVPVYAAGEIEGQVYLAMRYVEGDLKRLLRRSGPLEAERALALLEPVADALDAAHERGLVHRDVKPGNILVDGRRSGVPGGLRPDDERGVAHGLDGRRASSEPSTTSRPSRSAARTWTVAPTSTRSAACCSSA